MTKTDGGEAMYPRPEPGIQRFHFQLQDLELGGPKVTGTCWVSKFPAARMGLLCGVPQAWAVVTDSVSEA